MDPHTRNQAARTSYGVILAEATSSANEAHATAIGPFDDAQVAADAVTDFERFLAIGGRHLALLAAPAQHGGPGLRDSHRDLAKRLGALTMERRGGNAWADAGDRLGLAHDVLSTHVDRRGLLLSTEAEAILEPGVQVAAFARVLSLLSGPLADANTLLVNARTAQPAGEAPLSRSQSTHLRQQAKAAQALLAQAPPLAMAAASTLDELDRIVPTVSNGGTEGLARDALRVLRQISYRQSQGTERANAHTLADLCELGATACRAAQRHLPLAHTPLERVHRANSLDRLGAAEAIWMEVRRQLVPRVQGLSRAPGVYRAATQAIRQNTDRDPAVVDAVLAALPRLAIDASRTLVELHHSGELVAASRRPGELSQRWRPVTREQVEDLSSGFVRAGHATRSAYDAWRQVPGAAASSAQPSDVPTAARHLGLGATS